MMCLHYFSSISFCLYSNISFGVEYFKHPRIVNTCFYLNPSTQAGVRIIYRYMPRTVMTHDFIYSALIIVHLDTEFRIFSFFSVILHGVSPEVEIQVTEDDLI